MTAKQIDNMSIEAIEELANTLTEKELSKWSGNGYSGKCYIEIIKSRQRNKLCKISFVYCGINKERNMKLNQNQQILNDYLNEGNKLIQTNNRLYMNGEVLNTKTFQAVMRKLFGNGFRSKMKDFVEIKN